MFNLFPAKAFGETTEQVNQHYSEAIAPHAPLKKVYEAARPILFFAGTMALIPQEWRQILVCLVHLLDAQLLTTPQNAAEQATV